MSDILLAVIIGAVIVNVSSVVTYIFLWKGDGR